MARNRPGPLAPEGTPLHHAVTREWNLAVIQELLAAGTDVEARGGQDQTPPAAGRLEQR